MHMQLLLLTAPAPMLPPAAAAAVAELMRVLMDQEKLGWTKAWELVTQVGAQD